MESLWRSVSKLTPEERAFHADVLECIAAGQHHVLLKGDPKTAWLYSGVPFLTAQRRKPVRELSTVKRLIWSTDPPHFVGRTLIELDSEDLDVSGTTVALKPTLIPVLIDTEQRELVTHLKEVLKEARLRRGRGRAPKKNENPPPLSRLWEALQFYDKRQRDRKGMTLDTIGKEAEAFGDKEHSKDPNFFISRGNDVLELAEYMMHTAKNPAAWWNAFLPSP